MDTFGSRACEGNERTVPAGTGVEGREPGPSLVVARRLGVGGRGASSSIATFPNLDLNRARAAVDTVLTFSGRGDFSLAALMTATLLRARSLKGALASHSSREIWGFGCSVGVGGAPGRRCVPDRTADMARVQAQI